MVLRNHGVDDGSLPLRLISTQGLFQGFGITLFSAVATALFLVGHGPDGLPYVYLLAAAVMPLLYGAYLAVEHLVPVGAMVVAVLVLVSAVVGVTAVLVSGTSDGSSLVLYVPIVLLFVPTTYSSLANQSQLGVFYDARQMAEVRSRIAILFAVGVVAAGALVPLATLVLSLGGVIAIAAMACTVTAGIAVLLVVNYASSFSARPSIDTYRSAHSPRARPRNGARLRELWNDRFFQLLFAQQFLRQTATYLVQFLFLDLVARRFLQDAESMATLLGAAAAVAQTVGVAVLLIAGMPLLFRYGLRFGLVLSPVLVAITVGALFVFVAVGDPAETTRFWVITAAWSIERALSVAITDPSITTASRIQSERLRFISLAAIEGLSTPLAAAFAGCGLLVATRVLVAGDQLLLALVAVVALAWCCAAVLVARGHQTTMSRRLKQPSLGGLAISVDTAESFTAAQQLINASPREAALGLDMLATAGGNNYHNALLKLLSTSEDDRVLVDVIARIETERLVSAADGLESRISDTNGLAVRLAAMAALVTCEPYTGGVAVERLLADENNEIRVGAVLAMLGGAVLRHHDVAMGTLATLVHSHRADNRRVAAVILGKTGPAGHRQLLADLLADDEVEVREAAIEAIGRLDLSGHTPSILAALEDPRTRQAATGAIAEFGNGAVPGATMAMAQEALSDAQAVRILQAMAVAQTHGGTSLLASHLTHAEPPVRAAAIAGLVRSPYLDSSKLTLPSRMNRVVSPVIETEAARAGELFEVVGAVPDRPEFSALARSVTAMAEHHATNLFNLLAIRYRSPDLSNTNAQIKNGGIAAAKAKELIDSVAGDRERQLVASMLGQRQRAKPGDHGKGGNLQKVLATCDDDWTAATAVYGAALAGMELGSISRPGGAIGPLQENTLSWSRHRVIAGASGIEPSERLTRNGRTLLMAIVEKVEMLRRCVIFGHAPDRDLVDLAELAEQVTVGPGDVIQTAGEPVEALHIIVFGELEEVAVAGSPVVRSTGEVVGELEVLRGTPAAVDVRAIRTVELLSLSGEALNGLIDHRPTLAKNIISALAAAAEDSGNDEAAAEETTIDLIAEESIELSASSDLS